MKKLRASAGWIVVTAILIIFFVVIYGGIPQISWLFSPANTPPVVTREIVEYSLAPEKQAEPPTIPATKLPEFSFDLQEAKFQEIQNSSGKALEEKVEATFTHMGKKTETTIDAIVELNEEKHKLIVHPKDQPNFKPGKYKLSLTLRTIEGEVNIDQDFTWGVLALNTSKSIYKPGDVATIGMGVLNDKGETQCKTGDNSAKVWLTVTDPKGVVKEYSTEAGNIMDSGFCGPISVTNDADFVSIYLINGPGLYKMKMTAEVQGQKRSIEDYFKVQTDVAFDVERTSFPTRIYPMAPYNVTFYVTAKEDYTGTIEEFMPSDFKTDSISDNGKEEIVGEFKKITWQTTLKAGKQTKFSYTLRFPPISPEFYLLGPITIGEFKEARQWQIASDAINSTSGLVSYEDNGGPVTWSRTWTGTTWNPALGSAATSMSTTPGDSRWFREVSSPKTGEKIVVLIDNATNDPVMIFTWNGSSWPASPDKNIALGSSAADGTRPFDVAYEELSGDALVVISNYSSNQLRYIKRVAGAWDSATTFAAMSTAGTAYDVYKRWVRLEPQFESDSILVGYLNDNERVGAMIWDGATNSFGNQFADDTGTATVTSTEQAFDIAWETNSGTPMIFWGGAASTNIIMREFTGGSWQAESQITTAPTNAVAWLLASSDPLSSSNNISLAIQEGTSCVIQFGVWTGSSVTMNGTTATCPSVGTNNLVDTAFENDTGRALWTYVTSGSPNQITWLSWTSGGGFTSGTTLTGSTTTIEGVQLYSDLNTTSMMLLYHDNSGSPPTNNCQLWHREWDGDTSAWSSLGANPVHANMCASADNSTMPYGFGFDRNLETLVAYRWFENLDVANGGSTLNPLTTQDTPYTLTTESQAFRLRLLLYYPDSLLSSAFRQYKLQYVDPGTGTCAAPTGGTPATYTDVPTSGGTTISFNNNSLLNSGDNIATNSADPTYESYLRQYQDYQESNNFTNSRTNMLGDQVAIWDFSLIDNTTYDRVPQTYCFRVARSNDLVLRIGIYPQINTAAIDDVRIQGGSFIQGGTLLQ